MRRQVRLALGANRNASPREDAPDASGAGSAPTRKSGGDFLACRDAPDLAIQAAYRPTPDLPRGRPLVPGVPHRLPTRPRRRCGDGSLRPRLAPRVPPPGSRPPPVPSSSAALCSAKPLEPRPGLVKGAGPALKRPPAGCPTDCRRHRTASTPRESLRSPRLELTPSLRRSGDPDRRTVAPRSARMANPTSALSRAWKKLAGAPRRAQLPKHPASHFLVRRSWIFSQFIHRSIHRSPPISSSLRKPGSAFSASRWRQDGSRLSPG